MAGKNTIDAKLKIAADFADAVQQLQRLRAEMKGAKADAAAVGGDSGTKATTQAQKEAATAARAAASERTTAARDAATAEKLAAREVAAEARKQRQAEIAATREAAAAARKAAAEKLAAERATTQAARRESRQQAQLAPQVTDIVTGLASGQNPLLVAIQQGGQLRDIMGGTGNAVRALTGLFTPLRVAIGGAVGVAVLFGKAFFDARSEVDQLNRSIAQTGNAAGTTAAEVQAQAQQIARAQNTSVGAVRDTFSALLESGRFTRTTLNQAASAATAFSKATGQGADEAVKSFIDMSNGVTAWALKNNQQYRFVTAAQIDRIRTLESEGKAQEAMRVALEAFGTTMEQRVVPSTNSLERAWQSFGRTISNVWESWKGFFRDATQEGQIAAARKRIAELEKALASSANLGSFRPRMRAELEALRESLSEQERLAIADKNARDARADAEEKKAQEVARKAKGYQDALSAVSAAGDQKRLAATMAALDAKTAALENARKRDLVGELDYNLQINAIEQQRLQATAANLQRQIAAERKRVADTPEESLAKDARIQSIEAQLIGVQSRIQQTVEAATGLILDDANKQADEWARKIEGVARFVDQVTRQNAADRAASGSGDPAEQAAAAARAAVETLEREAARLRALLLVKIGLTLDPEEEANLRRQLQDLARESGEAISSASRRAQLQSLRDQFALISATMREREAEIEQAQSDGTLTSSQAERELLDLRAQTIPQLERILQLMEDIAATDPEKAGVSRLKREVAGLGTATTEFERTMRGSFTNSFTEAFQSFVTGAKSAGEAMRDFVKGVAQAMLNLIARRLGEQLVNSLFGAQGSGGSGAGGGGWAQFIASFFHGGGIVGGVQSMTRAVSPMLFATAARYHGGGIAGLAPDEVPAVLRKGEEVLTESDPRHRNNGGAASIGNLNISVSVSADGASDAQSQQLGAKMARAMRATAQQVLAEEQRPGGSLYRGA